MTDDARRDLPAFTAKTGAEIIGAILSAGLVSDDADLSALRCAVIRYRQDDCGCTPDSVCRQNGNCPRRVDHPRSTTSTR